MCVLTCRPLAPLGPGKVQLQQWVEDGIILYGAAGEGMDMWKSGCHSNLAGCWSQVRNNIA
jgi:hypothetical protein